MNYNIMATEPARVPIVRRKAALCRITGAGSRIKEVVKTG